MPIAGTWATLSRSVKLLRDDGLELLRRLPKQDRLPVHWGMTAAAYPFFGSVAETVGRLVRLQGSVAATQVQRRIREQFGERETVARAARRVLRCFVDWSVLLETADKGVYAAAPVRTVEDTQVAAWLVEAMLTANDSGVAGVRAVTQGPALFPFTLDPLRAADLTTSGRLELVRQGLDDDLVALRGRPAR